MHNNTRILATTSLYHALNDGCVAVIPILFPIFKSLFSLSYTQIGILTSGGLIFTLIAQLVIGRYADGKNFGTLLTLGILLVSASLLLFTQTTGFVTLIVLILIFRMATSFFHPIGVGWISRTFKRHRLDWAMGIQSGCADVGAFVAISTTLFIAEFRGWQYPLYLWSIGGILIVFAGISLTSSLPDSLRIVQKNQEKRQLRTALKDGMKIIKKIHVLIPAFIISGSAWGGILTYLPLYLDEQTTLSLSMIGVLVAFWIGSGSIASFFYGSLAALINRKLILLSCYFFFGLSAILLIVLSNVFLIAPLLIILGVSSFITFPALFSFVSEETHESIESTTFAITFTLQLGGGTTLLFLSGILADIYGIWIPFFLLGSASLAYMILLAGFLNKPLLKADHL